MFYSFLQNSIITIRLNSNLIIIRPQQTLNLSENHFICKYLDKKKDDLFFY